MANNFDRILNAIADLKTKVSNVEQQMGTVSKAMTDIDTKFDTLQKEVDEIKNDIEVAVTGIQLDHGPPTPNV